MNDILELEAIQQELERLSNKLDSLLTEDHPKFDDVFEDIGAARYYIGEINSLLKSVVTTLNENGEAERE